MVELLIEHGADVHATNDHPRSGHGRTALHMAAQRGLNFYKFSTQSQ